MAASPETSARAATIRSLQRAKEVGGDVDSDLAVPLGVLEKKMSPLLS